MTEQEKRLRTREFGKVVIGQQILVDIRQVGIGEDGICFKLLPICQGDAARMGSVHIDPFDG